MMKKSVVFKNSVNKANEEVQPVNEETVAIEIKTEVLRSDARTRYLCCCHLFIPELHILYIMLLQCMSIKSSIHNISKC